MPPLAVDLYCGLGGWSSGFLAEGYDVIGFDIERHDYGTGGYPGQLVIQDVLTLHGSQFKDAAVIVASPPCQEYSYMAMPWSRAKKIAAEYRSGVRDRKNLTALFDACFRIQREACEAAGRYIPLIVENVRGAQPWVGRSSWSYGSFHLWGDVPALMPMTRGSRKIPGQDWNRYKKTGEVSPDWHSFKTIGHVNQRDGHAFTKHLTAQFESDDVREGRKGAGAGAGWFDNNLCVHGSKSKSRKAASAQIAKIPFALSRHIARCFKPVSDDRG